MDTFKKSLIALVSVMSFFFSSVVYASPNDVETYLLDTFGIEYKADQSDVNMTCKSDAPTPANPGKTPAFYSCQESQKNGIYIGVGWKLKSISDTEFQSIFAWNLKVAANLGNLTSNDIVVCREEKIEEFLQDKGKLFSCKVEYNGFRVRGKFKNMNFSVFYPKLKDTKMYDIFVVSADDFSQNPELVKANVLSIVSRMKEIP